MVKAEFERADLPYISVFRISYRTLTHSEMIRVTLTDGSYRGRGEALGVSYHGETADRLLAQLEEFRASGGLDGLTRSTLEERMPPGGARNALDCALWDLEAKKTGAPVWKLLHMKQPNAVQTAVTISLDEPAAMADAARSEHMLDRSLLKLKLGGVGDIERVQAVRAARPDARLIVDANQAWTPSQLEEFGSAMRQAGVELVEQPLPAGNDEALIGWNSPIPLCADESCQTRASLASLAGKYAFVNIKLDKTGGLTEAWALAAAAKAAGLRLMVGCMGGSSLSMAPAFLIGQLCEFVDLDGPVLLREDIQNSIKYSGTVMSPPSSALWG